MGSVRPRSPAAPLGKVGESAVVDSLSLGAQGSLELDTEACQQRFSTVEIGL